MPLLLIPAGVVLGYLGYKKIEEIAVPIMVIGSALTAMYLVYRFKK